MTGTPATLSGSVPVAAFARRMVTIRLTRGAPFSDDGYSATLTPAVTVTLRRTRITTGSYATFSTGGSSSNGGGFFGTFFG